MRGTPSSERGSPLFKSEDPRDCPFRLQARYALFSQFFGVYIVFFAQKRPIPTLVRTVFREVAFV